MPFEASGGSAPSGDEEPPRPRHEAPLLPGPMPPPRIAVPAPVSTNKPSRNPDESSVSPPQPRLERNANVVYPGAYHVSGINTARPDTAVISVPLHTSSHNDGDNDGENGFAATTSLLFTSSQHSQSMDSVAYLVEASLVEQEQAPVDRVDDAAHTTEGTPISHEVFPHLVAVVHANPVSPPPATSCYRKRCCVGLLVAVVAIAVAVALVATAAFAARTAKHANTAPEAGTEAQAPPTTVAPTTAPSLSPVVQQQLQRFRESLPEYTIAAMNRSPRSPQARAFEWLAASPTDFLSSYDPVRWTQRFAMATLYYATSGDGWLRSDGWLSDAHECDWYAETYSDSTCQGNGRDVLAISFLDNQLNGTLPPEMGLLTSLVSLVLRGHPYLKGTIPTALMELTRLRRLLLDANALTGPIPAELASLTALENLALYRNRLTSAIPSEIYTNMTKLNQLWVYSNLLTGTIPSHFEGFRRLRVLELGANQFHGTIPTQLGQLTLLNYLSMFGNKFTGTIPTQLGMLSELRDLYLDHNYLYGTIPSELQSLTKAEYLLTDSNALGGTVPPELCALLNSTDGRLQFVVDCHSVQCECDCLCQLDDVDYDDTFIDDDETGYVDGNNNDSGSTRP